MRAILSRARAWMYPPSRAEAEAAFLRLAGSAAPIPWMEWLPGLALLGLVLVVFWLLPFDWLASLPGPWGSILTWCVLVAVPVIAEFVRASRSRTRLAEAYAAADSILGSTFLRSPGSLAGAAGLLVASRLPGLDGAAWMAAAMAAQAASELAVRCRVASSGWLRTAGQVVGRGLRSRATGWLAVAIAAVWLLPPPKPEPPTLEQLALQWRSDPDVSAADAALWREFAAAREDSAAPHDLLRLRATWEVSHMSDGSVAGALAADRVMVDRLRAFQAFWTAERERPYGPEELNQLCISPSPDPACRVRQPAGPVPGSDGTLLYRIVHRGEGARDTVSDTMLPADSLDVFQPADGAQWHHVLRVAYDPGRGRPRAPGRVASPAGALLVLPPASSWSIQIGEEEGGDQLYLQEAAAWHRIDAATWLRQAAAALPAGQCLLQTIYGVDRRPLGTDLVPDYATLTLLGRYGPGSDDGTASGLVRFTLGIEDRALVVHGAALTPYPDESRWWQRWLPRHRDC